MSSGKTIVLFPEAAFGPALNCVGIAQKLKAVYGTFQKMREELESERSVTMQRWARREKQLQSGVAELLGETLRRIAFGESVSSLYVD